VSVTCTRVAVTGGHTKAVTVSLGAPVSPGDVGAAKGAVLTAEWLAADGQL